MGLYTRTAVARQPCFSWAFLLITSNDRWNLFTLLIIFNVDWVVTDTLTDGLSVSPGWHQNFHFKNLYFYNHSITVYFLQSFWLKTSQFHTKYWSHILLAKFVWLSLVTWTSYTECCDVIPLCTYSIIMLLSDSAWCTLYCDTFVFLFKTFKKFLSKTKVRRSKTMTVTVYCHIFCVESSFVW